MRAQLHSDTAPTTGGASASGGVSAEPRTGATFADRNFFWCLAAVVGLAAAVRFFYVLTDTRQLIGGDSFDYHVSAIRLADGQGYTRFFAPIGAATAHHPPGWVTVLGAVSWLGGRSLRAHQLVGVVIGLGVVAVVGLVGRRYFDARIGLIAAVLAAVYPGFWVLEGNVLSEPLGLLVLGVLTLAIAGLRDHPTMPRSVGVGALCGVLTLVRSEQLALVLIVVVPVLLLSRSLSLARRSVLIVAAACTCIAVISPWAIYNSTRFKDRVLLSTGDGGTLLAGNCPPETYSGELLGWYSGRCAFAVSLSHPHVDESQLDALTRRQGERNLIHNVDRLPVVVPARFGRMLGLFNPTQTVRFVAVWMTTGTRPIWAWVASYWLLLPLAVAGFVMARRGRAFVLPLVAPAVIVMVDVAISYGEPRYHAMSDLGTIVLAAVTLDAAFFGRRRASKQVPEGSVDESSDESAASAGQPSSRT